MKKTLQLVDTSDHQTIERDPEGLSTVDNPSRGKGGRRGSGKKHAALGKAGAKLWHSIMSEYEITDAAGLSMLEQACGAADRVAEFSAKINADGPLVRTKTGMREHPLLKHELMARSFMCRTLQRLGLDVEPIKSARKQWD